jgi:hypothetical protein
MAGFFHLLAKPFDIEMGQDMDARLALSDPYAFCYQQLLVASAFSTPLFSLLRLQDENNIWRKRHHLEKGISWQN